MLIFSVFSGECFMSGLIVGLFPVSYHGYHCFLIDQCSGKSISHILPFHLLYQKEWVGIDSETESLIVYIYL